MQAWRFVVVLENIPHPYAPNRFLYLKKKKKSKINLKVNFKQNPD